MENLFIIPGSCSFGSQIALEWLNIPYRLGIATAEMRASQEFRKINPTGKVAALQDDDFVIGENIAILLYLADKYPARQLVATVGSYERAKTHQWLSYLSTTLHPALGQVFFPAKYTGDSHRDKFTELAYERLLGMLHYVNAEINDSGYLSSDKPSIVEAHAYAVLRNLERLQSIFPEIAQHEFSKIKQFLAIMEQDQAVKNALALEVSQPEIAVNSQFVGYLNK
jgi:glutathione S-transferase